MVKVAQDEYAWVDISTKATIVAKTGQGELHSIVINSPGTAWVLTVYDNVAGSGQLIATIAVTAGEPLLYDVEFGTGLTIVSSGSTAGDATVTFS